MTENLRPDNHDCSAIGGGDPCLIDRADSGLPLGCGGSTMVKASGNKLFFGDNLDVLREKIKDESVDLIYLDPPFNSSANYNVLFKASGGQESEAQAEAFRDTWGWGETAQESYDDVMRANGDRAGSGNLHRTLSGVSA
jgi:hypothetical protein